MRQSANAPGKEKKGGEAHQQPHPMSVQSEEAVPWQECQQASKAESASQKIG